MLHGVVASGFLDADIVSGCAIPGNPALSPPGGGIRGRLTDQLAHAAGRGLVLAAGGFCEYLALSAVARHRVRKIHRRLRATPGRLSPA